MALAARTPVSNFLSMVFLSCRFVGTAEPTRPHYDQARGKGKLSKSQMPDVEMSSVDPMQDKLTQCEKENFSLILAANHSEWLRDPLDGP
jgi:hypothetical protein